MKSKKKTIIKVVIIVMILFCAFRIKLFSERLSFSQLRNLYEYSELVDAYKEIQFSFEEGNNLPYPYHFSVSKNDEGEVEELSIYIDNLDSIQYSQICEVVIETRQYMEMQEDYPYKIWIQFNPVGSGEAYGCMWNYNSSEDEFYSGGMDWIIRGCNISVENCTELYEEYSLFVGYENVYIEDVSDYEVLTNWEGLECLKINCGNTPEEIELYNEALREMFPDGSVYIQTR